MHGGCTVEARWKHSFLAASLDALVEALKTQAFIRFQRLQNGPDAKISAKKRPLFHRKGGDLRGNSASEKFFNRLPSQRSNYGSVFRLGRLDYQGQS